MVGGDGVVVEHLREVQAVFRELVLAAHERLGAHHEGRHDGKEDDHQVLDAREVVHVVEDLRAERGVCAGAWRPAALERGLRPGRLWAVLSCGLSPWPSPPTARLNDVKRAVHGIVQKRLSPRGHQQGRVQELQRGSQCTAPRSHQRSGRGARTSTIL